MSIEGNRSKAGVFFEGEVLSALKLNDLSAVAGYGTTIHSHGTPTIQGPHGTVFSDRNELDLTAIYDYPFKVYVIDGTGNEKKVYVRPGTANNHIPKIGSKYLDDVDPPNLSFSSISSSNKKMVVLKVKYSTATFFPAESEIILLDDDEALVDADNYGYLQLASIVCKNETVGDETKLVVKNVYQYIYASQVVVRSKPGTGTASWSFLSR